jgi:hypothetical protein
MSELVLATIGEFALEMIAEIRHGNKRVFDDRIMTTIGFLESNMNTHLGV